MKIARELQSSINQFFVVMSTKIDPASKDVSSVNHRNSAMSVAAASHNDTILDSSSNSDRSPSTSFPSSQLLSTIVATAVPSIIATSSTVNVRSSSTQIHSSSTVATHSIDQSINYFLPPPSSSSIASSGLLPSSDVAFGTPTDPVVLSNLVSFRESFDNGTFVDKLREQSDIVFINQMWLLAHKQIESQVSVAIVMMALLQTHSALISIWSEMDKMHGQNPTLSQLTSLLNDIVTRNRVKFSGKSD